MKQNIILQTSCTTLSLYFTIAELIMGFSVVPLVVLIIIECVLKNTRVTVLRELNFNKNIIITKGSPRIGTQHHEVVSIIIYCKRRDMRTSDKTLL